MKQLFKSEVLSLRRCKNSIGRFYALATPEEIEEGLQWYKEAHFYTLNMASIYSRTQEQVTGVLAAFSPQTDWLINKDFTERYLSNPKARISSRDKHIKADNILKLNCSKAIHDALAFRDKAFKTKAFYMNILYPTKETTVTIDRHAIACCIQHPTNTHALSDAFGKLTKAQYEFFVEAYKQVAYQKGLLPHQLQAITWTVYRRVRSL